MSETLTASGTAGTDPTVPAVPGARRFWRRLREQRAALVAAVVVALLVLVALAAPLLTALEGQDPTTYHPTLVDSARGGVPVGPLGGISGDHWLGLEPQTGRDLFARLVYGARVSLGVALTATLLQTSLGVLMGVAAALGNRWVDQVLSRLTDIIVALPLMIMALALLAVVPSGFPRPPAGHARPRAHRVGQHREDLPRPDPRPEEPRPCLRGPAQRLEHVAHRPARTAARPRRPRPHLRGPARPHEHLRRGCPVVPRRRRETAHPVLGGQMLTAANVWYQAAPQYLLLPAGALFVTVLAMTVLGDGVRTALDPRAASRLRVGTTREGGSA
ncbi:hypothetical protein GCM10020256_24970 [Streptomyces thermocoprophilus]